MGFWINVGNGFSPGPRHYCELPPTRNLSGPIAGDLRTNFLESAGPTLCGRNLQESGYYQAGFQRSEHGGLSAVPIVNLLQSNLCGPCVRAYLQTRPSLAAAVEAAKRLRVDSV